MKDCGNIINRMDGESIHLLMETSMKASGKMGKQMVMVLKIIKMASDMKVTGGKTRSMGSVWKKWKMGAGLRVKIIMV